MRNLSLLLLVAVLPFTSARADLVPTSEFGPLIDRGLEDYISHMLLYEGRIVVSGPFLDAAGGVSTPSHVAAWDGNDWQALPSAGLPGLTSRVLAKHDGDLYCDQFRLEGDTWVELPPPGPSTAFEDIDATCSMGLELVLAGTFRDTGTDQTFQAIYAYDGFDWRTLAAAYVGTVGTLLVDQGELIIGGGLLNVDGVTVAGVARFDGMQWHAMGSLSSAQDLETFQGDLYAAAHYGIYRWNGSTWDVAGIATNYVDALQATPEVLYAGGLFLDIDGVPVKSVARYDGVSWSAMPDGMCYSNVYCLATYGTQLYVGGAVVCYDTGLVYIAHFDGQAWHPVGHGGLGLYDYASSPSAGVRTFYDVDGETLAGGEFARWGQASDPFWVPMASMATLVDDHWSDAHSGVACASVARFTVHQGTLYAAGLQKSCSTPATNAQLWSWDGENWIQQLGTSFGAPDFLVGEIRALASYGGELILAGGIASIDGDAYHHVARFDGTNFFGVGAGFSAPVDDLLPFEGDLVAAGSFTASGATAVDRVARWNGSSWLALGDGLNGEVFDLALYHGELYAAGTFTASGASPMARVAHWTGSSWEALGAGVNGVALVLEVHEDRLFVLGDFTSAGGQTAMHLASWDDAGGIWTGYDLDTDGVVNAIHSTPKGLLLGGTFTEITAGGQTEASHFVGRLVSDVTAVSQSPARPIALAVHATPNPFNPRVRISFELATTSLASVRIFDVRGRELRRMALGRVPDGPHHVDWDGLDQRGEPVASGVVFLEVRAGAVRGVAKAALVR